MTPTRSQKAADRMHADIEAMIADCERHYRTDRHSAWSDLAVALGKASDECEALMSERDRRIATRA